MSLWEFQAATDGYMEANGVKKRGTSSISEERLAEMGIDGF